MATANLDTLLVRIDADLGPLRRGLAGANQQISRTTGQMRQRFSKLGASVTALTSRFATLRAGIIGVAVVGAAAAGKGIANVNAQFQDLELTLGTVFGGMEQGQAAMDFIAEFAQRTPFDIQTLSRAFIQLGGAGIKPTEELLTTFGDAASATTNRVAAFEAMVRIATRAVGGGLGLEELEQLVNQGIPVYTILQEEIGVTRQEISDMGQSAAGAAKIMDALQTGLNKRFGGGMERASKNLSVSMSNLGIAMTELIRGLGDGVGGFGLTGAFTFLSDTLTQVAVILKPVVQLIGSALAAALYAVVAPIRLVTEGILAIGRAAADLVAWAGDLLPESWTTLREGAAALQTSLADLEQAMNANITPTEQVSEVAKAQEEHLASLNEQLKEAQALLAGYSQAQIDAWKASGQFGSMTFNTESNSLIRTDDTTADAERNRAYTQSVLDIENAIEKVNEEIANNNAYQEIMNRLGNEQNILMHTREGSLERQFSQMTEGLTLTEEQYDALWNVFQLNQELIEQEKISAEQREAANDQLQEAIDIAAGYKTEVSGLLEEQAKLEAAMKRFGADAIPNANVALEQLAFKIQMETNPMFKSMVEAAQTAGNAVADTLAEGLMNGKLSLDSFLDIAKMFVQQLIAEFIRTYIIKAILNSIFPGSGAFFGAAGGGTVPALAGGGRTAGGGPILVGERGPELFVPSSAGSIKNNHDTGNILGGGQPVVVQQTINVETGVSQTVRAEMLSLLPSIKQDTIQAVAEAKRRGGSFAQAFGG